MKKNKKIKIACVISGGKDGLFAYRQVRKATSKYDIKLFLNLRTHDKKASFHQYQSNLVALQAKAIGLPLVQKEVIGQYENQKLFSSQIYAIFRELKKSGIEGVSFGYILMGDFQDKLMHEVCGALGLELILPNYGKKSETVLKEFIESGIKAMITTVNTKFLGSEWLGRIIDKKFMEYARKNKSMDFCGDKGEYHTFVIDAPFFIRKIKIKKQVKKIFQTKTEQPWGELIEKHVSLDGAVIDTNI